MNMGMGYRVMAAFVKGVISSVVDEYYSSKAWKMLMVTRINVNRMDI